MPVYHATHLRVMTKFVSQILQSFVTKTDFEESHKDMICVLEFIGKQMVSDQNEGFALKVHYLSYLMQQYHNHGMQALLKRWDVNCKFFKT